MQTFTEGALQTVQISNSSQILQASDCQHLAPVLPRAHLEEGHTESNFQHSMKSFTSPSPWERQRGAGTLGASGPAHVHDPTRLFLWDWHLQPCFPHRHSLGVLPELDSAFIVPIHTPFVAHTYVCV